MIRKVGWALTVVLVAGAAFAGPKIEKRSFTHAGEERTFYLYAPESRPEAGVPLLLTFHGSGRDGASLVEKWTKLANRHGFVVAGMDSRDSTVWRSPDDGPDVIRSLVKSLQGDFPILERRIYLFGHSSGAVFALILGLLESENFAAVAVHAGAFRSSAEEAALPLAKRSIPVKIIVGDGDKFFPLASVYSTEAAFREHGIPIELEVVKGHDHWYYTRSAKFNESAWEFLSRHELPAASN